MNRETTSSKSPLTNLSTGTKTSSADLQKIFEDQLKDIYWAEKQLTKALPRLSKAANREELKLAFENHLEETKIQIQRLDRVFELLGKKAAAKRSEAIEVLVKEGEHAIETYGAGPGRDVALIISGQKVEHYEIATYGSLKAIAGVMDMKECHGLLDETFEEESNAEALFNSMATDVNLEAYVPGETMAAVE